MQNPKPDTVSVIRCKNMHTDAVAHTHSYAVAAVPKQFC